MKGPGYSYATRDPKGWGGDPRRGAAMGRRSSYPTDAATGARFYLRHVRLDSGGYDPVGTYWGHGSPLYVCADGEGVEFFLRANDREAAKTRVREDYPNARFYA